LKGPSLARWLYEPDVERTYGDTDLLVSPDAGPAAERVLERLGFVAQLAGLGSDELSDHWARAWRRDRSVVDLHVGFYGFEVDPVSAWRILSSRTEWMEVLGSPVETLAPAPKALLVVLHCAYHGGRAKRAMLDLERALMRLDDRAWWEATAVARELGAVGGLAAGLSLTDEGRRLAGRLGIADRASSAALLRRTEIADGLARLSAAPGGVAKARLLLRELIPSPAFLRWQTSLARRGRRGLLAAYAWRWAWLARRAPTAYRALRQIRTEPRARRRAWDRRSRAERR
jgi:hypothetical protein